MSLVTTIMAFSVHLLPMLFITMNNDYALHNTIPMMVYTKFNTRSGYIVSEGPWFNTRNLCKNSTAKSK